jgi:hypothetical protein
VSAEIIQFIPRPGRDDAPTDFPTIAFRSAAQDPAIAPAMLPQTSLLNRRGEKPSVAKTLVEIRSLARSHTRTAIRVLVGIMRCEDATPAARVSAANAILDRGWGKATQPLENGGRRRGVELSLSDRVARGFSTLAALAPKRRASTELQRQGSHHRDCDGIRRGSVA